MPRVLPSDIIKRIDAALPKAAELQGTGEQLRLDQRSYGAFLEGLVDLNDRIDDILLTPLGEDYAQFLAAQSAIRNILDEWESRGATRAFEKAAGLPEHPVLLIRRLLEKCPDQAVPEAISGLNFVDDNEMREELRQDLTSIDFQMLNRQWKAAMVLAGSVAEALLFEWLKRMAPVEIEQAVQTLVNGKEMKRPRDDLEWWHLPEYIRVARSLGIISERTKNQALLGGDYRNLIHPGKAAREKAKCSRAAALSVVASLEGIIEDLEAKANQV